MQIEKIKMINFRNYDDIELNFSRKMNILVGNNGVGKTNIVESIYFLSLTKSFRTINEKKLITHNQKKMLVEGIITDKNSRKKYRIELDNNGKKVSINDNVIFKISDYISKINIVIFNPNDLKIIKDTPNYRRKSLNLDISQLDNSYLKDLNNYNKVLKQRNNYIRKIYGTDIIDYEYLEILNEQLIFYGKKIYLKRKKFIEEINKTISKYYFKISRLHALEIKYMSDYSNCDNEKIMLKYKNSLKKDIVFGKTQIGIHHDDYNFLLNKKNLKDFGSQGQQKNAIISYKLSEVDVFKKEKMEYPILIFDDLFSELDDQKIIKIIKLLKKSVQIFITVTNIEKIDQDIYDKAKIIKIRKRKAEVIIDET